MTTEELQKKIEEAERNELLVIAAILRLQKYRAEREDKLEE